MVGVMTLYRSSIGKKVIMAVTGLFLIGFIVFHLYGNLKVFEGPDTFNAYAEGLRTVGKPIFGHQHLLLLARVGLIASFALHIWSAVELSRQRQAGRPSNYVKHTKLESNYANLTIRWGGVVIFLFILYHLMHFTFGTPGIHPNFDPEDVYHNVIIGFQSRLATIVYIAAIIALGMHLYHGTWSMFQTLGFNNRVYDKPLRMLGAGLGAVVAIGYLSIPLAILFGIVG